MTGRVASTLAIAVCAAALHAQSGPAFDVSSVKRVVDRPGFSAVGVHPGGRFVANSSTVRGLISIAYGLPDVQIVGGPAWMDADRFEVMATTRADVTAADARAMLRALLVDRFRLTTHTETRELPVYLLQMARDDRRPGPQLRPSGAECAPMKGPQRGTAAPAFVAAPPPPPPPPPPGVQPLISLDGGPRKCPSMAARMNGGGHWSLRAETMEMFANQVKAELDRMVIDRSGLEGEYDIDLSFASDPAIVAGADGASLMSALREQLGLRLESARAPVQVLVIDRVERPSEN
jgi:uncharacterized protein (TIGR03435 family)